MDRHGSVGSFRAFGTVLLICASFAAGCTSSKGTSKFPELNSNTISLLEQGGVQRDALSSYQTNAGKLATVLKLQGKEGRIAEILFHLVKSQNQDVNSPDRINEAAEGVFKGSRHVSLDPFEWSLKLEAVFDDMAPDLRGKVTVTELVPLLAAADSIKAIDGIHGILKLDRQHRMLIDAKTGARLPQQVRDIMRR